MSIESMSMQEMFMTYPEGAVIKLENDYPGVDHTVIGYSRTMDSSYLIFDDGNKFNTADSRQIAEIHYSKGQPI